MTEQEWGLKSLLEKTVPVSEAKKIIEETSSPPLYLTVFRQAEMYNKAYQLLESSMKKHKDLSLISPMIMNLCFSIELLLKAFILFEKKDITSYAELPNQGKDIRGHKYSDLFKKIKKEYQKNILSELSKKMNLPEIDNSVFEKILINQKCDNSFAEWRYIFEQSSIKSLNIKFLMHLHESIGNQLFSLVKNRD